MHDEPLAEFFFFLLPCQQVAFIHHVPAHRVLQRVVFCLPAVTIFYRDNIAQINAPTEKLEFPRFKHSRPTRPGRPESSNPIRQALQPAAKTLGKTTEACWRRYRLLAAAQAKRPNRWNLPAGSLPGTGITGITGITDTFFQTLCCMWVVLPLLLPLLLLPLPLLPFCLSEDV